MVTTYESALCHAPKDQSVCTVRNFVVSLSSGIIAFSLLLLMCLIPLLMPHFPSCSYFLMNSSLFIFLLNFFSFMSPYFYLFSFASSVAVLSALSVSYRVLPFMSLLKYPDLVMMFKV